MHHFIKDISMQKVWLNPVPLDRGQALKGNNKRSAFVLCIPRYIFIWSDISPPTKLGLGVYQVFK